MLASKGWYLFAVYTDTYSGYTTEDNGHNGEPFPITTVSSNCQYFVLKSRNK